MRPLVLSAVLAVLTGGLLVPAVPAHAQSAPAAGSVTVARGTCLSGGGTMALRQQTRDDGTTHVGVQATDVRNGRWVGRYTHPILGSAEEQTDTPIRATATDHGLATSFDVDGDTTSAGVVLRARNDDRCLLAFADAPHRTVVSTRGLNVVVRYPSPGRITQRILVLGCEEGSRWRTSSTYRFDGSSMGGGAKPYVCHHNHFRVPKSEFGTSADDARPSAFTISVHSPSAPGRRVSFRTTAVYAG